MLSQAAATRAANRILDRWESSPCRPTMDELRDIISEEVRPEIRALSAEAEAHRSMRRDMTKWWRFDNYQQPMSSWHERNDTLTEWDRRVEKAKTEHGR